MIGSPIPTFMDFKISAEWPPRFTKILLFLEGGIEVAFADPRRLGRIRFSADPALSTHISKLAPDALNELISADDLADALSTITAPIKAVLLDQDRLVSGVGNWIADEVRRLVRRKYRNKYCLNCLHDSTVGVIGFVPAIRLALKI